MRTALAARGYRPRTLLHGAATGRLATALFLRSHAAASACTWRCPRAARAVVPAQVAARALTRADVAFLAGARRCLLVGGCGRDKARLSGRDERARQGAGEDERASQAVPRAALNGLPATAAARLAGLDLTSATASASPCSGPTAPARRR